MKKTSLICVIVFNLCNNLCYSQDIHFSQFYQTPLIINPALTGTFNGRIRVLMNYKDQWGSVVENPYKTYALSYDMTLFKDKWKNSHLGAGFSAYNDKAGNSEFSNTQLNLSLSGIVVLSNSQNISAGLQGGFAQKSINYSSLEWGKYYETGYTENWDPILASGMSNNYSFGDFSAGVSWKYAKEETNITANNQFVANIGMALFHLNKPKQKFFTGNTDDLERLYSKLVLHGGTYIGLKNTNISLLPSVLFLMQGP
ncbi:MAG: PorP/SprF family type IX secretion system membrane protein, partial [Bacteroidota bacterium]